MNDRIKEVYLKLYTNSLSCTKENLKYLFNVTTEKTVENTLKDNKEIIYDRKLKRYRFTELLPSYIPYRVFYQIFEESINNLTIKKDFNTISNSIIDLDYILMIKTANLSNLSKKIIQIQTAINSNCVLKITYKKNGSQDSEVKFIKPHTIISNGFTYYTYGTYHEKNGRDVGQTRSFEFNRIEKIEIDTFVTHEIFKKEQLGNAFGPYNKDNFVLLEFDRMSTDFFKKANIVNNPAYRIVDINADTLTAKMFYNNLNIEVVKVIQQWMPHIKVSREDLNREKIYNIIKTNYNQLLDN